MKKMVGLLAIFFIVNLGQVFAKSQCIDDGFAKIFNRLAKNKGVVVPADIQKKIF